ncbi:MAG: 30S ribosome-binding factor RbfA [Planctomycetes bacterium]|nr:30S ribosome-binding factor RbfA [Planctomycetota bacterium]
MAAPHRQARVRASIRREASQIILQELKDPRLGFVTVLDAEVSGDLRHALVKVSVLGPPGVKSRTMHALADASGHIQSQIGRRLGLRFTPALRFELDESADRIARIEGLISRARSHGSETGEDAGTGEPPPAGGDPAGGSAPLP